MNLYEEILSKSSNFRNKSVPKYELPFINITIAGKKGEITHIIRKLNKSKSFINDHVGKLLYTGFNGTLEDFHKVYGKSQINLKKTPKRKIKLNNTLLLKSVLLSKPIQKTITKEFKFMNKDKKINMKSLLYLLQKNEHLKDNLEKAKDNLKTKKKKLQIYKPNSSQQNLKESMIDKDYSRHLEMKKINKIRKLLNQKSRNMLKNESNIEFQKSTFETIEEKKDEDKNKKLDRIQIIKSIIEKSEKKKKKNETEEYINETFKRYLNKKEDDKTQFKKILDPLSKGFKGNLKEIQQYEGKDRHNIWIKRSTANLVSFGNSFLLMADDTFYKDHKRIVSKYPDLERQADIIVPENKNKKDNKIIYKMEQNERKIRNILNDSDTLLKNIKSKYLEINKKTYSKSQHTNFKKKNIL